VNARQPRDRDSDRNANRLVTRAVLGLVLSAVVGFAVVGTGSVIIAHRIARNTALAEAVRSARTVGDVVFAPTIPALLKGDPQALRILNSAIRERQEGGALVRVKVWSTVSSVVYSDDPAAIGTGFPVSAEVRAALEHGKATAGVSSLDDAENVTETGLFDHLVEVYVPLKLDDGTVVAFEVYSTDARLRAAERQLTSELVPFALLSLLVLIIVQLPVAVWLLGRVSRAQRERTRWLSNSLAASGRERRRIAQELHEGSVQNLAGAGYALGVAVRDLPAQVEPATRQLLEMSLGAVLASARDLRNIIVEIHPTDLTAAGLETAIRALAQRIADGGTVAVEAAVTISVELDRDVATTVYRATREGLTNVAKHARATRVDVTLQATGQTVLLRIVDDGVGATDGVYDGRSSGHVGLFLLAESVEDLGGELTVTPGPTGGTVLAMRLPLSD
jgi:two-component system NarL family sensor kinase